MANGRTRVESGDVISAALMNDILDQLEQIQGGTPTDLAQILTRLQQLETWRGTVEPSIGKVNGIDARLAVAESSLNNLSGIGDDVTDLLERVEALEGLLQTAGKVRISGFDPPERVAVGQILTILGTGFKPTLIENLVFVKDTPVYNFRLDSDSTRLKIVVPTNIPNVTPIPANSSASVTIRVSNSDGEAQRPYLLIPALAVTGTAPRITGVVNYNQNGQNTGPVLHPGHRARITGTHLRDYQNPQTPTTVRFIYRAPTGPASYPVTQTGLSGEELMEVPVPDIREAPVVGTFDALLEIARGNHVPALAQVTMSRVGAEE